MTTNPFLALHDGAMDVGNDGMGARNAMVNSVGIGDDYICVQCKFGLEADS